MQYKNSPGKIRLAIQIKFTTGQVSMTATKRVWLRLYLQHRQEVRMQDQFSPVQDNPVTISLEKYILSKRLNIESGLKQRDINRQFQRTCGKHPPYHLACQKFHLFLHPTVTSNAGLTIVKFETENKRHYLTI